MSAGEACIRRWHLSPSADLGYFFLSDNEFLGLGIFLIHFAAVEIYACGEALARVSAEIPIEGSESISCGNRLRLIPYAHAIDAVDFRFYLCGICRCCLSGKRGDEAGGEMGRGISGVDLK